jgi:hypothetical protein
LLQEEMKRVKAFFQSRASRWEEHAEAAGSISRSVDPAMVEGLRAFAREQSTQFCEMRSYCEYLWRYVETFVALGRGNVVPPEAEGDDEATIDG